jgi:hypothetical protein
MKRLVEREFPAGTIEAKVSVFLNEAEPFQAPLGAKQRVRARLIGSPLRGQRPWFFRPVVVFAVLTFAALAGAGVWRSKLKPDALPQGSVKAGPAKEAITAPIATTAATAEDVAALPGHDTIAEGPTAPRSPEPSAAKSISEPPAATPVHRGDSAAAVEASVLFEATGALRRDGDAARASRILDDYFRKFPRGALAEEALALSIEAASVRGDAKARTLAKRYLELYPKGNFRAKAERVLARTGE